MITDATKKEIRCKLVYYGVGLGGKTTNCVELEKMIDPSRKSELQTLNTEGERTVFFDFFTADIKEIRGFKLRVQIYTVPGQSQYEGLRKNVLRGTDAVILVADSQPELLEENLRSRLELAEFLKENGKDINTIPYVLQLNKRDLPNVLPVADLKKHLQFKGEPVIEAVAVKGIGVQETCDMMIDLIVAHAIEVNNL
jgi:signal recognition particle receptor subunit beta